MILQQYIGKYFNIFNRKKEYKIIGDNTGILNNLTKPVQSDKDTKL